MPEVSASAQQSGLAVAVGVEASPAAAADEVVTTPAPTSPVAPAAVAVPHNGTPHNGEPLPAARATAAVAPQATPTAAKRADATNPWGKAIAGYVALIVGTLVAFLLPTFHLHAGFGEATLVVVSIAMSLTGAGLIAYTFVRDAICKL